MNRSARFRVGFSPLALRLSCAACFPGSPNLRPALLPSATEHVIPTSISTQAPTTTPQAHLDKIPTGKINFTDNVYSRKLTFPAGWPLINQTAEALKHALAEIDVGDPNEITMITDTIAQFPQGGRFINFPQADILNPNGTGTTAILQPRDHSTASAEAFDAFLEGVTETLRTDVIGVRLLDSHLLNPISVHPISRVELLQEIALNESETIVGRNVHFYTQTSEDLLMLMTGSQEAALPMIDTHIPEILDSMEFNRPWP